MAELEIADAWGLAVAIGLVPDPETDRPALDELADAMLVWAEEDVLDPITTDAVVRIWGDELRGYVRDGLEPLTRDGYLGEYARVALLELDERGPDSAVARAVVQFVAQQLSQEDHPWSFCMCCLDEAVRARPEGERRELAVRAALVARRDAAVEEREVEEALRRNPLDRTRAIRALATDERRAAVRRRLRRLARLARGSMPELAAELDAIGAEPVPEDPAADDAWLQVAEALLDDRARPELN